MRVRRIGSDTRVTVSALEVSEFKDRWPCSELPDRAISFTFDSRWDLIDLYPRSVDGLALSQDAQEFAEGSTVRLDGGS